MRSTTLSVTGTSQASPPCPLDTYITPYSVSLSVVVSGTIDYTVQYTYNDVFAPNFTPASATWFNVTALAAKTATLDTSFTTPCTAVRIVSNSGTGRATLTVIQAGIAK